MRKGAKIVLGVVVAILIVIGVALFFVWSNLDSLVASGIENYGSQATGTEVSVGSVRVSLRAGTAELDGLTIDNPRGYQSDYALKFDRIRIGLDIGSLGSNTIVMDNAIVDGASVNAEFQGTQSNLAQIMDNLKRFVGPSKPSQPETGAQKKFIVKTFRLTNGKATAMAAGAKRSIDIPDISVQDIGVKSGGVNGSELARQILRPIIAKVLEQASGAAKQKALETLKKKAEKTLQDKLKGVKPPPPR